MSGRRRLLAASAAVFLWTAAVKPAAGAPPAPKADPREIEYTRACATGDVDKGIKILGDLYAETLEPVLIYNQGRCYQQNGRVSEALNRFREYLRKAKDITKADREEVVGFIKELEELEKRGPDRPAPAAAGDATSPPPAPRDGGSPLGRKIGIGVTIAAGAFAVGGATLMALSWSKYLKTKDGKCGPENYCNSAADTIGLENALSKIFFGASAVAGITGGVLLYMNPASSEGRAGLDGIQVGLARTF